MDKEGFLLVAEQLALYLYSPTYVKGAFPSLHAFMQHLCGNAGRHLTN
jgi:hypothetical protein